MSSSPPSDTDLEARTPCSGRCGGAGEGAQKAVVNLVDEYSVQAVGSAIGSQAELLLIEGLALSGFQLLVRPSGESCRPPSGCSRCSSFCSRSSCPRWPGRSFCFESAFGSHPP